MIVGPLAHLLIAALAATPGTSTSSVDPPPPSVPVCTPGDASLVGGPRSRLAQTQRVRPSESSASEVKLAELVVRVTDYVANYLPELANVVAEEDYVQTIELSRAFEVGAVNRIGTRRHLISDLLLLQVGGPNVWVPFRDVISVDGTTVRNRDDRLRKLFLERPSLAMREAQRITAESARYNIGTIYRTLNLPTLPLVFLTPAHVRGFQFRPARKQVEDGTATLRIDYKETGHPTVMRRTLSNEDMPASGSLWVDRLTGRIEKTLVETTDGIFTMRTTVTYRRSDDLGLWVPATMYEEYAQTGERTSGTAAYSKYRRFQVKTETEIKLPKR